MKYRTIYYAIVEFLVPYSGRILHYNLASCKIRYLFIYMQAYQFFFILQGISYNNLKANHELHDQQKLVKRITKAPQELACSCRAYKYIC